MTEKTPSHITVFRSADPSAHAEAGKELLTVSAISSIPFLIGAAAYVLNRDNLHLDSDIRPYLSSVILQGQLFLISVSYISTSLYRLWNSAHSYERPDAIAGFSLILFGVIGVFYGLNPNFAKLTSNFSRTVSILFFFLSVAFYYYTAVLSYFRPKRVADALENDVKDLEDRLKRRRGNAGEAGDQRGS